MANVIIMDNRPYIRYRVKELLEKDNMFVHEVANSSQLYIKLNELNNEVALIILEINLKDEDGIEIIKKLRKKNVNIPFMVLTLVNTREAFIKSVKAGAVDYFLKPFDDKDFTRRVIRHAMTKDITVVELPPQEEQVEVKLNEYAINKITYAKYKNESISFIMFIVFKSENDLTIDLNRDHELFSKYAYDKLKTLMTEADRFDKYGSNVFIGVYPSVSEDRIAEKNEKLSKAFADLKKVEKSFAHFYFDSVYATFPEDGNSYEEIKEKLTARINNKILVLQRKNNNKISSK